MIENIKTKSQELDEMRERFAKVTRRSKDLIEKEQNKKL